MKKKLWTLLLCVVTTLCLVLGFAACGEENNKNTGNDEEEEELFEGYGTKLRVNTWSEDATISSDEPDHYYYTSVIGGTYKMLVDPSNVVVKNADTGTELTAGTDGYKYEFTLGAGKHMKLDVYRAEGGTDPVEYSLKVVGSDGVIPASYYGTYYSYSYDANSNTVEKDEGFYTRIEAGRIGTDDKEFGFEILDNGLIREMAGGTSFCYQRVVGNFLFTFDTEEDALALRDADPYDIGFKGTSIGSEELAYIAGIVGTGK